MSHTCFKSSDVEDTAIKYGRLGIDLDQAAEEYFCRRSFTCGCPSVQSVEKYERFVQRYGKRYLDVVPLRWRYDIFNGFEADGCTPHSMGGQRGMAVSAEMEAPTHKKILLGILGRSRSRSAKTRWGRSSQVLNARHQLCSSSQISQWSPCPPSLAC